MRLLPWLPRIAVLATFGLFAVDKWASFRTVATSVRGVVVVAMMVASYAAIGFIARRTSTATWLAPVVLTGVVIGLAAWTVLPYYTERTAMRTLVLGDVAAATPTPGEDPAIPPAPAPAQVPAPAGPVQVSSGDLVGIDHDAGGQVSIIETPDGAMVVRFQDFSVEGTPDPRLHLVPMADAQATDGGIELATFDGTQGDIYDLALPQDTDVGPGWTVLLWCHTFDVPIARATQVA